MSAPPELPFRPWWHHPNHRYVGKHRGTYQWANPNKQVLPYGLRSVRLTPYIDEQGRRLSDEPYFTIAGLMGDPPTRWSRFRAWLGNLVGKKTKATTYR